MRHCDSCDIDHTNWQCPRCGGSSQVRVVSDPPTTVEADDELLAEDVRASRPTLAELVRQGLKKGYIKSVGEYVNGRFKS
jgi:hypothetical protein